jgi:CYTH domain-containing protein
MIEIELEKTYLAKNLPDELHTFPSKEVKDIYVPKELEHPTLRIRRRGDKYEITKKQPIEGKDSSEQYEHTILLTKDEFSALEQISGKTVRKIRYKYPYKGVQAEIDVFQDDLLGLVLVDFEFKEVSEKNKFEIPEFCLVDITQDDFFAGGMLCGKKYSDIENHLNELGYKKIITHFPPK